MSTVPFPSYDELAMQMQFELRQSTHLRCLRVIAASSSSRSKLTQLYVGELFVAYDGHATPRMKRRKFVRKCNVYNLRFDES